MVKVEGQSRVLEGLETLLNQQDTSVLSTNSNAAKLRKVLPLKTHSDLVKFEKFLEYKESRTALVSDLSILLFRLRRYWSAL